MFRLSLLALAFLLSSLYSHAQTTPVIAGIVQEKTISDTVETTGTLRSEQSLTLRAQVTERVSEVLISDNQRVSKGQILVKFDTSDEQAQQQEQNAFLSEANKQIKRFNPLVKKGSASVSDLDANTRNKEAAQARLQFIQAQINQRILRAPFDGVLGLHNITVGTLLQPGDAITTLDNDSAMYLDFSIPEVFLASVMPGLKIKAFSHAYPNTPFEGEIKSLNSRLDPVTRSLLARAVIPNPSGKLKPGLLMRVTLFKNQRDALTVPEESLLINANQHAVYVIDDQNTIEKRLITIGQRQFGHAEVIKGLQKGERIVTHGISRVGPNSNVNIKAIDDGTKTVSELLAKASDKSSVSNSTKHNIKSNTNSNTLDNTQTASANP